MKFKYILFDLDGTVTDSGPGIMNSVKYALAQYGIENPDPAVLRRFVGPPLHDSFERYYGFTPERAKEAVNCYRTYYAAGGIFENALYDGMEETLKQLQEAGCVLCLATSKPQVFAEQILDHFGIRKYFTVVVGSFLDGTRVDKAEVIEEALRLAGVTDENRRWAVMAGDRHYDIAGAKKMGLFSVGAVYGYGSRKELEEAGADWLIDQISDLPEVLA